MVIGRDGHKHDCGQCKTSQPPIARRKTKDNPEIQLEKTEKIGNTMMVQK